MCEGVMILENIRCRKKFKTPNERMLSSFMTSVIQDMSNKQFEAPFKPRSTKNEMCPSVV
jgi:hypothetical protein